jgi:tetratricopeptide (TPR) repeat protein
MGAPGTDSTLRTVEAILADPDPARWADLLGAPRGWRAQLVPTLKAGIDGLARARPKAALAPARLLVELAEDLPEHLPLALRGRAVSAYLGGDAGAAARDYRRAAELYSRRGDELEAARIQRSLVDVYGALGQVPKALASADAARPVFERRGQAKLLAQLEINVGIVMLTRVEDGPAAARHLQRAMEILEREGDLTSAAIARFNLALANLHGNRLEQARDQWVAARGVFEDQGLVAYVADCDFNLAYLEAQRGRFSAAFEGLQRAREGYREQGQEAREHLCELDLAALYLRLGACRDAKHLAGSAERGFRGLGHGVERAKALVLAAEAQARLGEGRRAGERLTEAADRLQVLGCHASSAAAHLRSRMHSPLVEPPEQLVERLRGLVEELRSRGSLYLADLCLLWVVQTLMGAGRRVEALEAVDGLLERAAGDGTLDVLVRGEALRLSGRLLLQEGRRGPARAALERAVELAGEALDRIPRTDLRTAFFRGLFESYFDLAGVYADSGAVGDLERSLLLIERCRAQALQSAPHLPGGSSPRELRLRERLDWLLARRLDAEFGEPGADHDLPAWVPSEKELSALQAELACLGRARADGDGAYRPFEFADLAAARGREGEVLLAYACCAGVWRVFIQAQGALECRGLEFDSAHVRKLRDRLELHVNKLRLGADYLASRSARLRASLDEILAELGRLLLEPLADVLDGRAITVVPFGKLHGIPFHALRLGGRALVERHEVGYAPSVAHMGRLRTRASRTVERLWVAGGAEGDPAATAMEIDELLETFGARAQRMTPADAVGRLRGGEFEGGALHLSGHGVFDAAMPQFSAVSTGGAYLLAHDLRRSRLELDLVTLSGCDTGRGRLVWGEEQVGLPNAFLAAGARAVVAGMWALEDGRARACMGGFYAQLAAGTAVRAALNQVQRDALAAGEHVGHWAPFFLFGDPDIACTPVSKQNP